VIRLAARAAAGLAFLVVAIAGFVFVPAGTVAYPQAWLILALFAGASALITGYLLQNDRALLARRIEAGAAHEGRPLQRAVQVFASVAFAATFVVPGLDRRLGWSSVSLWVQGACDMLVAAGFVIVFFVFRANTFAAATITVEPGQQLVTGGPYGVVRHPMYAGAALLIAGIPPALGSWWGLIASAALCALIVIRLLDEERYLRAALPGYPAYCERVRYRLVPLVF
jgi:protein-S-isoprenylcysteine O-methyltransferase Ste14